MLVTIQTDNTHVRGNILYLDNVDGELPRAIIPLDSIGLIVEHPNADTDLHLRSGTKVVVKPAPDLSPRERDEVIYEGLRDQLYNYFVTEARGWGE